MAKFMMIYKGEATDMSAMTPDEVQTEMGKWMAWMEKLGPAILDMGAPFGASASVVDDGSSGATAPLTGYTVVEAGDLSAAQKMTDGHPYLAEGNGKFAVDIFELHEMG